MKQFNCNLFRLIINATMKTLAIILLPLLIFQNIANAQTAKDYYYSGLNEENQMHQKKAIVFYTMALELNPQSDSLRLFCYFHRAWDKQALKDYKGSVEDYTSAIAIFPMLGDLYYNRGVVEDTMGNYEAAIPDFTKAIEINPNDWQAYVDRGFCKNEKKEYKEAVDDFTASIAIFPNKFAFYDRAISEHNLGNFQAALFDLNSAIDLDSNYYLAYLLRSNVKKDMGDLKGAASDLKMASKAKSRGK